MSGSVAGLSGEASNHAPPSAPTTLKRSVIRCMRAAAVRCVSMALIWRASNSSELYLNYGQGFHSNDARGTTIRVDPSDPSTTAQTVPGLVRTTGQELGWRSELWPGWQSTLVLWQLDSASELIFVGDATMSPYEILQPGGSVEYNNEEAGAEWLQRLTHTFPKFAWINPEPQGVWQYRQSIAVIQQLMSNRMFPLTLKGLEDAMRMMSK